MQIPLPSLLLGPHHSASALFPHAHNPLLCFCLGKDWPPMSINRTWHIKLSKTKHLPMN